MMGDVNEVAAVEESSKTWSTKKLEASESPY
jgi:hypothetical protein